MSGYETDGKALKPDKHQTLVETKSLRLRAAWLYHVQGLRQITIAERLGISRAMVIRILDEAKRRNEIRIWVDEDISECLDLSFRLEETFAIDHAIVVPAIDDAEDPARTVGAQLGKYLSQQVVDGMVVGVGWGRTLSASIETFAPSRLANAKVVSLMGGIINPGKRNPIEFSWRLAGLMNSECYLYLAPVIVDKPETKKTLLTDCGLSQIETLAATMDMAVVSCGDIGESSTSLAEQIVDQPDFDDMVRAGAVGDVMCNFIDKDGASVDHPIGDRTMSVDLDVVASAKNLVLATGGSHRAVALLAAIRRMSPNTLITDENAAKKILSLA